MKEKYGILYACPYCKSPLDVEKDTVVSGEIREGSLVCAHDDKRFTIKKGIPRLVTREEEEYEPVTSEVEEDGETHVIIEDPAFYPNLKSIKNKQEMEIRNKNYEKLLALLREENKQRVLEIGSGNCWLANRLADYYEVFALDTNTGPSGLEVSDIYFNADKYFERVQGEPANLPLASKSFDVVVCSAALHKTNPEAALGEISRVLKDDGVLYIVDSAIYSTPEGARQAQEEQPGSQPLYKKDLDKALKNRYDVKYYYPTYQRWWSLGQQVSSLLLRKEFPATPIIRARKRS